jgi:hypothetical protein
MSQRVPFVFRFIIARFPSRRKLLNKLADSLTIGVSIFVKHSNVQNTNRKLIRNIRIGF